METILSSHSIISSPLLNPKPSSSPKTLFTPPLFCTKPTTTITTCSSSILKKQSSLSLKPLSTPPTNWFSHAQQGLAALALSLALNFCPLVYSGGNAVASEFDVLNEGPPKESCVVDDAGVLSRVTRSDQKRLLSDLESRKNLRVNFVTVRKLTSKAAGGPSFKDNKRESNFKSREETDEKRGELSLVVGGLLAIARSSVRSWLLRVRSWLLRVWSRLLRAWKTLLWSRVWHLTPCIV